jgi:thioredoxin-dependent peroxiredoxin
MLPKNTWWSPMLKAGDRAPGFSNPDADMNIVELSQFRGKTLVLYFYVRDDTPGCTTEAIEFSELENDFAKLGATVLGVSRDDCIKHGEFRDKHGISVRLAGRQGTGTCKAYGVLQDKEVDGVLRKAWCAPLSSSTNRASSVTPCTAFPAAATRRKCFNWLL